MARLASNFRIYVGPMRDEAPLPVVAVGADHAPGAGWTDVTARQKGVGLEGRPHEATLTVDLKRWAIDTATWPDGRQVLVRARQWDDDALAWGDWSVVFCGYVAEAEGGADGSERGPVMSGTVTCRQQWSDAEKSTVPDIFFGRDEIAQGQPTTASSTLGNPAAEAGVEYASAISVGPAMAVDGNRDTVWISNNVAGSGAPTLLNMGGAARIVRLYADATGLRAFEIRADSLMHAESFETGLGIYAATQGAVLARTTAWAAPSAGSWSAVIGGPGGGACPVGGGLSGEIGGLIGEMQCRVEFTMKGDSGPATVDVLIGGGNGEGAAAVYRLTVPEAAGQRFVYTHTAGRHGTIRFRTKFISGTKGYMLDDIRVYRGVELEQGNAKGLYLYWENGLGANGTARISRELDIDQLGGGKSLILAYDAEAFRQRFDPGEDATVVQWRNIPNLTGLDFAPGRGRLLLAMYRRYPDLVGDDGAIWDDVNLSGLPTWQLGEALRRTGVSPATWTRERNATFGGAGLTGTAWLRVKLPPFPTTTLQESISAGATTIRVANTDRYPLAGPARIDNERVWMVKTSPTTATLQRGYGTAAASHAAGAAIYPEVDGDSGGLALVSSIGLSRRAGTAPLRNFAIIGTRLANPRDPAVPDPDGNTWGRHADWFTLVDVRGNTATDVAYIISRDGRFTPTTNPPPVGQLLNWGRPVAEVGVVIDGMGGHTPSGAHGNQRAKVNELRVWAADLGSGASGGYAGTNPPDARGIVGHILTQYVGIPTEHLAIDRGDPALDLPWGAGYGEMQVAAGPANAALEHLEQRGLLRVAITPTGLVRVIPDPLATAAAWAAPEQAWTASKPRMWRLTIRRRGANACAQVIVIARDEATGRTLTAAYPRTPRRFGRIETISDVLLGTQQQVTDHAIRLYRQLNAPWEISIDCGYVAPLTVWARHLVTYTGADAAGAVFDGHNFYVTGYRWRAETTRQGVIWRTTVDLASLEPWG